MRVKFHRSFPIELKPTSKFAWFFELIMTTGLFATISFMPSIFHYYGYIITLDPMIYILFSVLAAWVCYSLVTTRKIVFSDNEN